MVWGTFFRDEVPQSARLSAGGGGGQKLFGQCPNSQSHIFGGASLKWARFFLATNPSIWGEKLAPHCMELTGDLISEGTEVED